ncbi:Hypothetical predicted protein [Pelobates cultripes]|uniref:Uncharacterized protein n=1 Tax=Pelobates cultripes TaxID=61616 RepID=A0AAD1R0W6_PELCU|nr:Hypothetical predicted protein [Pelobates cultripes]
MALPSRALLSGNTNRKQQAGKWRQRQRNTPSTYKPAWHLHLNANKIPRRLKLVSSQPKSKPGAKAMKSLHSDPRQTRSTQTSRPGHFTTCTYEQKQRNLASGLSGLGSVLDELLCGLQVWAVTPEGLG